MNKGCEICGFDKITEMHHIIKKSRWGSYKDSNLIRLCPNHHKMADSSKYEIEILDIIFSITGKKGETLNEKEITQITEYICAKYNTEKDDYWFFSMLAEEMKNPLFYKEVLGDLYSR